MEPTLLTVMVPTVSLLVVLASILWRGGLGQGGDRGQVALVAERVNSLTSRTAALEAASILTTASAASRDVLLARLEGKVDMIAAAVAVHKSDQG